MQWISLSQSPWGERSYNKPTVGRPWAFWLWMLTMARKKVAEPVEAPASEAPALETEYTVVARRYRPQQFSQLVGQDAVLQSLSNAIKSGRVAHAYLFTGARGVGKTSMARILAKCLNCEKGPTLTPCDQCDICKGIASGEDVDCAWTTPTSGSRQAMASERVICAPGRSGLSPTSNRSDSIGRPVSQTAATRRPSSWDERSGHKATSGPFFWLA